MKIYNFNYPFTKTHSPYWNLYHEYIQYIWHQTQSLYDYIINFNPPYDIINGINNTNKINNILTDDIVNGWYGVDTTYLLLTSEPADWDDNYTNYYIYSNQQYIHNTSSTWQDNTYYEKITDIYYADRLNFRQGFINTGQDGKLRIDSNDNQSSSYIEFLSGYVCFCNTNQPGNNRTFDNYILLPASVPSLYWYSYTASDWVAQYYDNKVGNRIDAIIFTLPSEPCRFNYKSELWGFNPTGLSPNSNSIKTIDNVLWTGEVIQPHHYYKDSNEEIFIESTYKTTIIHTTSNNIKTLQHQVMIDRLQSINANIVQTYII